MTSNSQGFRDQLDQMTERLVAAERRAQTLAELNRLLAQGRDPLAFAQRAVDLVMRASGSAGTFVYLWDAELERLVLRVATMGRQAAHVGEIQLRLGEGVTGWSALMRQTVVLHDDIQGDPRFAGFPVLDEGRFRSMVAVPIVVPGGDLLGVFSLWSTVPSAFGPHAVDLATEVGGLLASGLLQAQTVEDLRRQSAAARFLLTVPADATTSLQRCVDVLAASIRDQVDATLCTIELADRPGADNHVRPAVAFAERVDAALVVAGRSVRSRADLLELVARLGADHEKLTTSFGQLFPLGALTCYRPRPFTEADASIIEALSAQAAALISSFGNPVMSMPLAGRLAAAPTRGQAERLLQDLGWRPGPTHAVVVRIRSADFGSPAAFDRMSDSLHAMCRPFDGAVLVSSAPSVSLLIRHQPDQWKGFEQTLRATLRTLRAQSGTEVFGGIGPMAADVTELQAALEAAETAVSWAEVVGDSAAVVHHQDIAHLRTLPKVALNTGGELREAVSRFGELVRYDLRHGTTLAQTLDTYLANRCSVTDTASALFIHRNTLRQRLARIEELTGRSPDDTDDWTIVALAARLSVAENDRG